MPTRDELMLKARPKRVPVFEANRNKINVAGLDQKNFMYRWVNDVEDRLVTFVEGGWEFVDKKGLKVGDGDVEATKGTGSALHRNMGRGVTAYLMRIPYEIWLADQKKKSEDQITFSKKAINDAAKQNADYGKITVEVKNTM